MSVGSIPIRVTSRLCLQLESILRSTFDSFGDFVGSLRTNYSDRDDWKLEIKRLRPPCEERISWVRDTGGAVNTDGVEAVLDGTAVAVAHFEKR